MWRLLHRVHLALVAPDVQSYGGGCLHLYKTHSVNVCVCVCVCFMPPTAQEQPPVEISVGPLSLAERGGGCLRD